MTLSDALRAMSDQDLAALLRARPDLAAPAPGDIGVLAHRAGVRLSAVRALELLDAFSLEVLDALVLLGPEPVPCDRLTSFAGTDVRAAVDRLRGLALVWGGDDGLHVVGIVREVVLSSYPARLGRPYAELAGSTAPDEAELPALIAGADDAEQQVLRQLAAGPPIGTLHEARRPATTTDESPVRRLLARGLLVPVGPDTVELPREVGLLIRGDRPLGELHPAPPPVESAEVEHSTVDKTAAGQVLETLRLVGALLEALSAQPAGVLRAGGLGVRDLRRLARAVDLPEPTTALLLEVAYAAGLLDSTHDVEPQWLPTPAYDAWRARPPEQRWGPLAGAWLAMPRVPGLVGQRDDRDRVLVTLSPEIERVVAADVRRRVLGILGELPAGSAPTGDSMIGLLTWRAPRRGGRLREDIARWTLAEAETLGVTGRGALASFARPVLAGADPAAALGALLPEPLDHVLLQADLTAVAPGPLEPDLAEELALVADVESAGGATVYRITPDTIRRALDAGRTADELHELFRERSRTPVPQALTYLVDDTARRHGGLRAGAAGSYLRCPDESLLAELVADRRVERLGLRRLAPTVAVCAGPPAALLEAVRQAGYAPVLESPEGALLIEPAREAHRAAVRRPARRTRTTPPHLSDEQLDRVVRDLRAGEERARAARRAPVTTSELPGVTTASVLAALQHAVREASAICLSYVDNEGAPVTRTVRPRGVSTGFLRADDERTESTLTVALHRITAVAPA